MQWVAKHPQATIKMLGYIPDLLSDSDPRSAKDQINANYAYGGGWAPFKKNNWLIVNDSIKYLTDPPHPLLFEARLRDETIRFYNGAWVAIVQPDGSFEVARID
jgi:hypothetical protein